MSENVTTAENPLTSRKSGRRQSAVIFTDPLGLFASSGGDKEKELKKTQQAKATRKSIAGSEWLFGHGFVRGGTSIFRNSMSLAKGSGSLPYDLWGLIAQHCPSVEDVIEMTNRHGVAGVFHVVVADEADHTSMLAAAPSVLGAK